MPEKVPQISPNFGQGASIPGLFSSFKHFSPKRVATEEGPTPVFKRVGGKERAIYGRNIYFLFSYFFFQNSGGISDL